MHFPPTRPLKPVWIWSSGLQTFLRSRVDSLLSLLPNKSIVCFNTIEVLYIKQLGKKRSRRCCTDAKRSLQATQFTNTTLSSNTSEMASIPNDNSMKNSRQCMITQPKPTSWITTQLNWPSIQKTQVNGTVKIQQQTIIWKISQNAFGTSHWWIILPRNNYSLWYKHVNIRDAHKHTHHATKMLWMFHPEISAMMWEILHHLLKFHFANGTMTLPIQLKFHSQVQKDFNFDVPFKSQEIELGICIVFLFPSFPPFSFSSWSKIKYRERTFTKPWNSIFFFWKILL